MSRYPPPNNPPNQPPISYKTVPGRVPTKKWQQAKTYNYDGDDWGGYDAYDEYGAEEAPPPPQPQHPQQRQPPRQNSFDGGLGSERRQFSGPAPSSSNRGVSPGQGSGVSTNSGGSAVSARGGEREEQQRAAAFRGRNFTNPEHAPPPLSMRGSPARPGTGGQQQSPPPLPQLPQQQMQTSFPPRQSSISNASTSSRSPVLRAAEPVSAATFPLQSQSRPSTADKPLPFIRPADIYKRMAEEKEKERASMDSARRPSVEGLVQQQQPQRGEGSLSPTGSRVSEADRRRPSLGPVVESDEMPVAAVTTTPAFAATEHGEEREFGEPVERSAPPPTGSSLSPIMSLPPVNRVSGFGTDFFHSAMPASPTSPTAWSAKSIVDRVLNAPVEGVSGSQTSPLTARAAPVAKESWRQSRDVLPEAPTRAAEGHDPAGDILAERDIAAPNAHVPSWRGSGDETGSEPSSHELPAVPTRAPEGNDPAGDILAERGAAADAHQPPSWTAESRNVTNDSLAAPTRAPEGHDPAGDILAERLRATPAMAEHAQPAYIPTPEAATGRASGVPPISTRAQEGHDPAADVLAERQHVAPSAPEPSVTATSTQDIMPSVPTRAPEGHDPAADILAERQRGLGQLSPTDLQHTPSAGFRSVVHTAFDHRRNESTAPDSDVSRSNTTSTGGVSPILGRVGANDDRVPATIDEVRTPSPQQVPRKATPSHSRNVSAAAADFQPGYRRSLDPPSSGNNSPARTPGLEDTSSRRVSAPLAAETFEAPDVVDQAAEVPAVGLVLHHVDETPAGEANDPLHGLAPLNTAPIPATITGRGRSGTDYSVREADLAQSAASLSPTTGGGGGFSPQLAEAEKASQQAFLRTHNTSSSRPVSPALPRSPGLGLGFGRSTTPNPTSPARGSRVREIAGSYDAITDASRRNSEVSLAGSGKSSWSNFRGSEEDLGRSLRRKNTGGSSLALAEEEGAELKSASPAEDEAMFPEYGQSRDANARGGLEPRPAMGVSQPSFRPHLPGEWVSAAPTPMDEAPPALRPRSLVREVEPTSPLTPRASQIQDADEALELTPTTKKSVLPSSPDFSADKKPAGTSFIQNYGPPAAALAQVKSAGDALAASLMNASGLVSQSRDFAAKDTPAPAVQHPEMQPKPQSGEVTRDLRPTWGREESEMTVGSLPSTVSETPPTPPTKDVPGGGMGESRPVSSYFSGASAPSPLRPQKSAQEGLDAVARPRMLPMLSTDTGVSDLESDRLRKEIVRSLGPEARERMVRESIIEADDDLDGGSGAGARSVGSVGAASKLGGPGMLDQRFSWENKAPGSDVREPLSPEVKPEMPYERPRSLGLHVMNAGEAEEEVETPVAEKVLAPQQTEVEPVAERDFGAQRAEAEPDAAKPSALQRAIVSPGRPEELVSPISEPARGVDASLPPLMGPQRAVDSEELGLSPVSDQAPDSTLRSSSLSAPSEAPPSYAAEKEQTPATLSTAVPTKRQSTGKIPAFRTILAINNPDDRIKAYNDTRETFADMNTGLSDWLSNMLVQHPEHANLSTPNGGYRPPAFLERGAQSGGQGTFKHRTSPSIAKFTQGFSGSSSVGTTSTAAAGAAPGKTGGDGSLDVEKMQQKGKEMLGKFSGKAGAGAKGLFAKGKSRFGSRRESGGVGDGKSTPIPAVPQARSSASTPSAIAAPNARPTSVLPSMPQRSRPPATLPLQSSDSPFASLTSHTGAPPTPSSSSPAVTATTTSSGGGPFARLRERSRSKSTSRSKSKSRPVSLAITNPDLLIDSDDERMFRSTGPAQSTEMVGSAGMLGADVERRREAWEQEKAWEEPDDILMQHCRREELSRSGAGTPSRLGVLPSPTAGEAPVGGWTRAEQETTGGMEEDVVREVADAHVMPGSFPDAEGAPVPLEEVGRDELVRADAAGERDIGFVSAAGARETPSEPLLGPDEVVPASRNTLIAQAEPAAAGNEMNAEAQSSELHVPVAVHLYDHANGVSESHALETAESAPMSEAAIDTVQLPNGDRQATQNTAVSTTTQIHDIGESLTRVISEDADEWGPLDKSDRKPESQALSRTMESNPDVSAPTNVRPVQRRKVSALASLPSQQRGVVSTTSPNPRSSRIVSAPPTAEEDPEDLYTSTPTTLSPQYFVANPSMSGKSEDGESTPSASRGPVPWAMPMSKVRGNTERRLPVGDDDTRSDTPAAIHDPSAAVLQAPVVSAEAQEVPRAGAPVTWDQRSEVSAEEHHGGLDEQDLVETNEPGVSRRSSISSIGSPDTLVGQRASAIFMSLPPDRSMEVAPSPKIYNAQEGISGPDTRAAPDAVRVELPNTAIEQRANAVPREILPSHAQSRSVSYVAVPRGADGAPGQDSLYAPSHAHSSSVESRSAVATPAVTPPLMQRNSGMVQSSPYAGIRSPSASVTPSAMRSRDPSFDANDKRRSRRLSSFFGKSEPNVPPAVPMTAPPPNAIRPDYGLEDVMSRSGTATPSASVYQSDDRPVSRRSGAWDTVKRSNTSSKPAFSTDSSVGLVQSPEMASDTAGPSSRPNTLKKPQRAATTATPPTEPMKKSRFSALGSLFGRSNTQGRNTARPNKLQKSQQPSDEPSQRQALPPNRSMTASSYEQYEAIRKQHIPDLQSRNNAQYSEPMMTSPYAQGSRGIESPPDTSGYMSPVQPAGEWNGPQATQQSQSAPPVPQNRRLHSSGTAPISPYDNVPKAFQPTELAYGQQPEPIGPPIMRQPPTTYEPPVTLREPRLPNLSSRQERQSLTYSPPPMQQGQQQYGSMSPRDQTQPRRESLDNLPYSSYHGRYASPPPMPSAPYGAEAESPEIARRQDRDTYIARSPIAGSVSPPPPRSNAMSPVRSYYAASPPSTTSRHSSYGIPMSPQTSQQYQSYDYATPPPVPTKSPIYRGPTPRQMSGSSYPSPQYTPDSAVPYSGNTTRSPPPQHPYGQGFTPRQPYAVQPQRQHSQNPYPPPPPPQQYDYDDPSQYQQRRSQQPDPYAYGQYPPPPQQQRYYGQGQQDPQMAAAPIRARTNSRPESRPGSSQGHPLGYQRQLSDYTGRRDEQDAMHMRGASFPGQEWVPRI